jgi:RNA polymerase sigma-70 factor (ECF subfamily)
MPPQPNETELVSRAQNGDRNAFSELVRANTKGVLGVVYRMCGDVQLAEDAAQETFIQAWLKLPSYRPQTSLRNWLYRIAVNNAIDILRKEKRILPGALEDLTLVDANPGPVTAFASKQRSELIRDAVAGLPGASRAVLILREYEDLSYQEISETLEIPIGTVMSRLNYARKLLKEKLSAGLFSYAEVENV